MDALAPTHRIRRLLLPTAAAAAAGYGLYLLYHHHRRRVAAVLSLADALSQVGTDLADFLRSDSDEVPQSLLQLSKLAASDRVSSAASTLSESVASGLLRALSSHRDPSSPPLQDRILDRLLSPAGTGFASAVLGSFARNLVLSCRDPGEAKPKPQAHRGEPEWLAALCSDRGKEAAAELVRVFVSTAVATYLNRPVAVRTCTSDQVLVANPKQEAMLKDLLVSMCNGAVETFVRTWREASNSQAEVTVVREVRDPGHGCVMERVSSTLAVPNNRRLVLDVTGRVTAETVRSLLEFSTQRVSAGARKSIVVARNEVAERGLVAVKYLSAKSMAIYTLCLAMCMHISVGMRFMLPA
ncbi:protein PHLOEM PROTEIN 2-LIKE A10-like [Lolium rigidum]|uniref:protein PHLOEM PROTEIN 2-LIKE A10-like n=1 Tax=Lolium rigidum TaxID=89674 RepID=UPI001F5E2804|nr:protein PHLOEM PROTEIN 2-LIKE A10-like [Lolium rigidum]